MTGEKLQLNGEIKILQDHFTTEINETSERIDELQEKITSLYDSIKRIETAIVGSPALGHKGLVERLNALEIVVERHEKRFLTWGGALAALIFILQIAPFLIKLFGG